MSNDPAACERFLEETRDVSPAHLLIKIESFSLFSKHGIDMYESRPFEAGGYKWKLIIYPEGVEKDGKQECYVSVYFSIAESSSLAVGWEANAICAFFLYNKLMDNYLCFRGTTRRFNVVIPKWGFKKMISKKDLMDPSKGYVVDDNCVFGAEVFVVKPQRINECYSLLKDTTMFKRDWKIPNFSLLPSVWNSEEFEVGKHNWMIQMHPKGDNKAKCIAMFLKCVDSVSFVLHQKVMVEGFLRIKNKHVDSHHSKKLINWFSSTSQSWGYNDFLPIADMKDASKGFLVNDCCFLEIEFSVLSLVRYEPKI